MYNVRTLLSVCMYMAMSLCRGVRGWEGRECSAISFLGRNVNAHA